MNKSCSKCFEEKPISDFYRRGEKWRAQCKSCIDARNKFRYDTILKHDEAFMNRNRERGMQWYKENRERASARIAANHRAERRRVIDHYGPNCACCGEDQYEFLSIDHTYGGGTQHRKSGVVHISRWLIKNNFPAGFRVLCHNCNQAYGFYGCCPHQKLFSSLKLTGT